LVGLACALAAAAIMARAVDLQVLRRDFLRDQGEVRHVRTVPEPTHRGMLLDREGAPLAISTPVWSIWADPSQMDATRERLQPLARALDQSPQALRGRLDAAAGREFVWLERHLRPAEADEVMALGVAGVRKRREFRRYYPTAEVSSHVVGFTGIDDRGQEGLELAFDEALSGQPGRKRVVQDRHGRVVEALQQLRPAEPGQDVRLSIDRRLQYLAYRELKSAVTRHDARAGSLVMLDVATGEVLAMVNQPAFNPNDRDARSGAVVRNRAATDVFEPGSTMKPMTIAAALATGRFEPSTPVFSAPDQMTVGGHTITDDRDLGSVDVTEVVQRSSNVGASRIALSLEPRAMWRTFAQFGLGAPPGSGFPGEASGQLTPPGQWGPVEQATMAFGYGVAVTPLQLARAYAAIANDGVRPRVRFRASDGAESRGAGERILAQETAREIQRMLDGAVSPRGTGQRAAVTGYKVAGKTGTAHKLAERGYAEDRYRAVFAGFAPAADARIAAVVMLDEPQGEQYYGGQVAAPVFAQTMAGALRLLDIEPQVNGDALLTADAGGES
jgi:cell division protein FtsI (penicillin-binding protein 3)